LLARLQAALPLPARVTPELAATLQTKNAQTDIPSTRSVTGISYAGDEGGIVCRLDFTGETETATFTSITHLRFAPACRWLATSPPTRSTASNACGTSHDNEDLRITKTSDAGTQPSTEIAPGVAATLTVEQLRTKKRSALCTMIIRTDERPS
jgi:hypothetical protein